VIFSFRNGGRHITNSEKKKEGEEYKGARVRSSGGMRKMKPGALKGVLGLALVSLVYLRHDMTQQLCGMKQESKRSTEALTAVCH